MGVKKFQRKEQRFISIITVYASSAESLVDMMRYDSCFPATEEDAYKLGRLMSASVDPNLVKPEDHIITLTRCARNDLPATEGRWRSFNCHVLDERHPEAQPLAMDKLLVLARERRGIK